MGIWNWIPGKGTSSSGATNNERDVPLTYYEELGVSPTATTQKIKLAYNKLILLYHPDHNPNGEAKAKFLIKCYRTLSDSRLRRIYDAGGAKAVEESGVDFCWTGEPEKKIVYPKISTVLERCKLEELLQPLNSLTERHEHQGGRMTPEARESLIELRKIAADYAQEHIVDAFGQALSVGFQCAKCHKRLELDGICYCRKAASSCHCNAEGCCTVEKRGAI